MRLLFVIPTTGGPLVVTALRSRPGLPVSTAFAEGDFRGLPWSGDYARLCAPGGPLSRVIPQLAPHELRLSGSFDAGRSWEAPAALAHLLLARGHACAASLAEAEAIIWTTGAIDLDLAPIAGDYALTDKIERTAALLAEAPDTTPMFAILPPAPDAEAAWTRLQAIANARPVMRIAAAPIAEAAAALLERMAPAAPTPARRLSPRAWWSAVAAVAVALAVAGGLGTYGLNRVTSEQQNPPEPAPRPMPVEAVSPNTAENDRRVHDPPKRAPSSWVIISEIRPPPGLPSDRPCVRVLFNQSVGVRHAVPPLDDTTFTPSKLDGLCGIAIKPVAATDRLTVEGDLPAASLRPTIEPDGAATYFLRADRQQNIVYQIQVSGETESGQPRTDVIRHAIVR